MILARSLFWRIYATLLASLILAAALVALLWSALGDSPMHAWREMPVRMLEAAIPPADIPPGAVAAAAARLAAAVEGEVTVLDAGGHLVAIAGADLSRGHIDEQGEWDGRRGHGVWRFRLHDGRSVLARFGLALRRPGWHVLAALLAVALAVGVAALPIVARLTHRLERLRRGVEQWGGGDLSVRVPVQGQDEIAAVAASFNLAVGRIQALLDAHRALLANASHELRSPLARLTLATDVWQQAPSEARHAEIARNLAELDQLIGEILLASRLEHAEPNAAAEHVDLLALAAEEAARTGVALDGEIVNTVGDPKLLRRMLRNLLENAAKHGAPPVELHVGRTADGRPRISVADRGPGLPDGERERIFEPFYRPAGRREGAGGWGLGLSLVRQIAARHNGTVRCTARAGGGSVFVVELGRPAA